MFPAFSFFKKLILTSTLVGLITLTACSKPTNEQSTKANSQANTAKNLPLLTVYKSPTCGCCEKWLDHINKQGFQSIAHNSNALSAFKKAKGIAPKYRSCHTAISKAGYIFEGHVPAKFMHQFLAEQNNSQLSTNILGLAVPAMPIGTPGMEIGDKFMPYQILQLNSDGSSDVYATINAYQEQF